MTSPAPPRRRWFRLLVLLAILAAALSLWYWDCASSPKRHAAGECWVGLIEIGIFLGVAWVLLHFVDRRQPPDSLRPQMSLKGLFVWVTLLGIVFGWMAIQLTWLRDRHRVLFEEPPSLDSRANGP